MSSIVAHFLCFLLTFSNICDIVLTRFEEVKRMKIFKDLCSAINDSDDKAVERLLGEHDEPLPELFLILAEESGNIESIQAVLTHWQTYGFEEPQESEPLSPIMVLLKKGHLSAVKVAAQAALSFIHDYTDKDRYGMTVFDWARVIGREDLAKHFLECLTELEAGKT